MPPSNLHVTCSCGQRVQVTAGMAGTSVRCPCGRELAVPTLGELKRLRQVESRAADASASNRGVRLGVAAGGVALALIAAAVIAIRSRGPNEPPRRTVQGIPLPEAPRDEKRGAPGSEGPAAVKGQKSHALSSQEIAAMLKALPFPKGDPRIEMPEPLAKQLAPKPEQLAALAKQPAAAVRDPDAAFGELCSTCHVLPTPDVEPRELWPAKIRQMYGYMLGPRPVPPGKIPPIELAIHYWASRAPEYLAMPPDAMGSPLSKRVFTRREITLDAIPMAPAVSCVEFVRLAEDAPTQLLISDMAHGVVVLWTPSSAEQPSRVVGRIAHPSRTEVIDLDGDGLSDILVANLGDFWPVDTAQGSVVWLRNRGQGQFQPVELIGGLGRVNEVRAADFDSDGDLDLVVGVFGNLTTGVVLYLENCTQDYESPDFEAIPLDYSTGASDVPVVDLNDDGHADFLLLQSQEKEHVLAFLNRGWGSFRTELLYKAPHPRWGSTGIRLVDLDRDGDVDVLLNHGDAFQFPPIPRPYHGVSWLENTGSFPFTYHRLAHLPGAQTSLAGDLDGDGDLDVVASAFVPGFSPAWPGAEQMDTIVWLEQTSPGQYERWSLETRTPYHACGALGDYDGDGDIDIIMGNFVMFPFPGVAWEPCLTVLENEG